MTQTARNTTENGETRAISIREFRNNMAEILNLAAYGGLQIGLARHGKVVAFIVSPEDVEQLRQLREERVSPGFRDAAERLMDKHSKLLESLAKK